VAFKHGDKADPLAMYLNDVFTVGGDLAGLPAISLRGGFSASGLPIGLQLMARPFDEARLLRAAYTYEQSTDWLSRRPDLG
jgi:aspartyl-tRNA(Asn)/glutamyl-tRNA(Gln) amidotransferase subunit A